MELKITKSNFSKFYSIVLAWIPLLGIYKSFIPGLSIGEFILVICCFLGVFFNKHAKSTICEKLLILFAFYSLCNTVFSYLIGIYELFWFHRLIRILLYIFCICYISKNYFQEFYFFKSMFALSVLLFFGMVVQYLIFYGTGIYFRLFGNIFPIMEEELLNIDYQYIIRISVFRPSSFFTEPSHVAQYLTIPLIYSIYHLKTEQEDGVSIKYIIMILSTILLSKSLWGYVILLVVFGYWILDNSKKKKNVSWYIFMPLVIVAGTVALINSSLFKDTFSRIQISDLSNSQAFTGRFGGYEILNNLSALKRLFGNGFAASVVDRPISNSVLLLLYGSGLVGTIIFIIFILSVIKSNYSYNCWKRTLAVSFFVLMFGSNVVFSTVIILFCSSFINYRNSFIEGEPHYEYRNKSITT